MTYRMKRSWSAGGQTLAKDWEQPSLTSALYLPAEEGPRILTKGGKQTFAAAAKNAAGIHNDDLKRNS